MKRARSPIEIDLSGDPLTERERVLNLLAGVLLPKAFAADRATLALQVALVSGLVSVKKVRAKPGPKPRQTQLDQILLWAQVETLRSKEKPKPKVQDAIRRIGGRGKGPTHAYYGGKALSPVWILAKVAALRPDIAKAAIAHIATVKTLPEVLVTVMEAAVIAGLWIPELEDKKSA